MRGAAARSWRRAWLFPVLVTLGQLPHVSVSSSAGSHGSFPSLFPSAFPRSRSVSPLSQMVRDVFINSDKAEEEDLPLFSEHLPRMCKSCTSRNVTRGISDPCTKLWLAFLCRSCHASSAAAASASSVELVHLSHRCHVCSRNAVFGRHGQQRKHATHCRLHAAPDEVNLHHKKCVFSEGCNVLASFGNVGSRPLFCSRHKLRMHVDVTHFNSSCKEEGCIRRAFWGKREDQVKAHCAKHKKADEVDLLHKTCMEPGCPKLPTYGLPSEAVPRWCAGHSDKSKHTDVVHKRCLALHCSKQPSFGCVGDRLATFCGSHRSAHHVSLFGPRAGMEQSSWEVNLAALQRWREENPEAYLEEMDGKVGRWLSRQRSLWRQRKLEQHKEAQLLAAGVDLSKFQQRKRGPRPGPAKSTTQAGGFVRMRRKARQFQGALSEAERTEAFKMRAKQHQPAVGIDQLCNRPPRLAHSEMNPALLNLAAEDAFEAAKRRLRRSHGIPSSEAEPDGAG